MFIKHVTHVQLLRHQIKNKFFMQQFFSVFILGSLARTLKKGIFLETCLFFRVIKKL